MTRWALVGAGVGFGKNELYIHFKKYKLERWLYKRVILGRVIFAVFLVCGAITCGILNDKTTGIVAMLMMIFLGLLAHFFILPKDIDKYLVKIEKGE